jgi:hypothetical protein
VIKSVARVCSSVVSFAMLLVVLSIPSEVIAQQVIMRGTAFLGDTVMSDGTAVLHHLTQGTQGELDSTRLGRDGAFRFSLPREPDPILSDIFFASIRHNGVLYFGPMIRSAEELDSVYRVSVYDTLIARPEGFPVPIQSRSVFIEPDSSGWRVTDLFELRNDEGKTIVARPGGDTWRHRMPVGIRSVEVGEGEVSADAVRYLNGEVIARAALPPGGRLFVVRYKVDSLFMSLPVRPGTERLDVLIREPAPTVAIDGLDFIERQEFEPGSTYRRFAGADLVGPVVTIVGTEEVRPPHVEWVAVLLGLVLVVVGSIVLRPRSPNELVALRVKSRQQLMIEVARLDEGFEVRERSESERKSYERRRAELIRTIRELN